MITETLISGDVVTATVTAGQYIFNGNEIDITGLIVLAALTLFAAIGVLVYNFFSKDNGYPAESEIEKALMPYLYGLIVGAFEESISEVGEIEDFVNSIDKSALAIKVYDMLPQEIAGKDISFLWSVMTEEQFSKMFSNAFEKAKELYLLKKGKFLELFENWK